MTNNAIKGIFYNFDRSKNIPKIQTHVRPRVITLKVEKVSIII